MLPKKLVPNISFAVLSMYFYTPCRLGICAHRGRMKILYNNFLSLYDPFQYMPVAIRPLCVQMRRRQECTVHVHPWNLFDTYQSQEFSAFNVLLKCDVTGANVFPRYGREIIGTWSVPQERALVLTYLQRAPPQIRCPLFSTFNGRTSFFKFKDPELFPLPK